MNLTTKDAMAILGVCKQRISQLIADGRIVAIKEGRKLVITDISAARVRRNGRRPGAGSRTNKPTIEAVS